MILPVSYLVYSVPCMFTNNRCHSTIYANNTKDNQVRDIIWDLQFTITTLVLGLHLESGAY